MAKSPFSKRDDEYNLTRRALIKWSVAAGAALGVSRSKIFEILEKTAGKGVAHAAALNPTHRSVHLVAGNGGAAWFQLLWPLPEVAQANSQTFAWHRPGQGALMAGTNKPLFIGPDTPGAMFPAARQMSVFIAGDNETHTGTPQVGTLINGNDIHASVAAVQAASSSVIPYIGVGDVQIGGAQGAGAPTIVGDGNAIVGLFNSAASRAGGLLSQQTNATLYKAHYDTFAQLNRASGLSTQRAAYTTASNAAKFLGTNLSARLAINDADRALYGLNGGTRGNVRDIAETLIIAVKAFQMGLTNSVVFPAMRDDPHGAFNGDVNTVPTQLKNVFDGFFTHLTNTVDDATGKALIDDVVMSILGDTVKDPLDRNGWPDGTKNGANFIWVWGNGHIDTGWHGQYNLQGNVQGILPNGQLGAYNSAETSKAANAAILHSIAKRDARSINQLTGNFDATYLRPLDQ